jgi:hypothetical protein
MLNAIIICTAQGSEILRFSATREPSYFHSKPNPVSKFTQALH